MHKHSMIWKYSALAQSRRGCPLAVRTECNSSGQANTRRQLSPCALQHLTHAATCIKNWPAAQGSIALHLPRTYVLGDVHLIRTVTPSTQHTIGNDHHQGRLSIVKAQSHCIDAHIVQTSTHFSADHAPPPPNVPLVPRAHLRNRRCDTRQHHLASWSGTHSAARPEFLETSSR